MQDKTIYDRIWVYLQLNSYIGKDLEEQQHRFIYKDFESTSELYRRINTKVYDKKGKEKNFFSYNTFTKSFKTLQKLGYITQGKILDNKRNLVDVYYLKEDFIPFKLIPMQTLEFLMNTKRNNIVKIYATLLNWYKFKRGYRFTQEELANAIGYTSKCKNVEIQEILWLLKHCGLIQFTHTKVMTSSGKATYYYVLNNVNTTVTKIEQENRPVASGEFCF